MSFEPGLHSASLLGPTLTVEADAVVLGAGAGGCATAFALAREGLTVAVFEEGRHWSPRDFQPSNRFALRNLYQERGARGALGDHWLPVNGGRGVGGSTLINSAISFRIPAPVLAGWRERTGFDPEGDFEALTDEVWRTVGVLVNPEPIQGRNNTIFKEGAEKLGLKGAWLARGAPGCVGCGACQIGCPSGGKNSADRTFLAQAVLTGRVGVWADCKATGVVRDGDRIRAVTGLVLDPSSHEPIGRWEVRAKVFVLSGGPVGSPRFLMSTGLSRSEHVGRNLHLHPAAGIFAAFDEDIEHWRGVSQGYYVDGYDEGWLLETSTVTPDVNYVGLPVRLGPELNEVMADLRRLASAGAMVHDEDTEAWVGSSTLHYRFGEEDRRRLLRGLRACARVYFAAGARYAVSPVMDAPLMRREADIPKVLHDEVPMSRIMAISSHPMGTCRMGHDPRHAVVDTQGRVYGLRNLHVADASLFPSSLGVNPQITVMACGLMVGRAAARGQGA